MITVVNLIIFIIFIVIVVLFCIWYSIFIKYKNDKKEIKKTEETEKNVDKSFCDLHKKIKKQIAMLDGKPGLSEGEKKIYDRLREALNGSEKIIREEIEKNVKDNEK